MVAKRRLRRRTYKVVLFSPYVKGSGRRREKTVKVIATTGGRATKAAERKFPGWEMLDYWPVVKKRRKSGR